MSYFTKDFWKIIILTLVVGFASGIAGAVTAWTLLLAYRTELIIERTDRPALAPRREPAANEEKLREAIRERVIPVLAELWRGVSGKRAGSEFYLPSDAVGRGLVVTSDGWIMIHRSELSGDFRTLRVGIGPVAVEPISAVLDSETEVVFLKVQGANLSAAEFGGSTTIRGGDELFVIAGPDILHRVTVHRTTVSGRSSSDRLDTAFTFDRELPGAMVGSPLVTNRGEVVGLVNSKESALPIHEITGILKTLLASGELLRPALGVSGISLAGARLEGGGKERGFLIINDTRTGERGVARRSAAETAGIRDGDVLLKINDTLINGELTLAELLLTYKSGDTVDVRIARGEEEIVIPVTLGLRNTGKDL